MIDEKRKSLLILTVVCSILGLLALLFPPTVSTYTTPQGVTRIISEGGPTFIYNFYTGDSIDIARLVIELIVIGLVYIVGLYLIKNKFY